MLTRPSGIADCFLVCLARFMQQVLHACTAANAQSRLNHCLMCRALLFEDGYGKLFQADVLGAVHAVRVLNTSLFPRKAFDAFLAAAAPLRHAHLVAIKGAIPDRGILVHDLPEAGNALYLLQSGQMPSGEPLQWNDCIDIALAVASALQFLHSRREPFAHGGLTASNVLVDRNGVAKVAGAGLQVLCAQEEESVEELLLDDAHALGTHRGGLSCQG